MKRFAGISILTIIAIAWIWAVSSHFYGLNSLLQVTNYRTGIPGLASLSTRQTTHLPSPAGPCRIEIDTLGIPHIFGSSDNAVAYAVGYMHARDRYFQMELMTHSAMGRLSEMIGKAGLPSDKRWKTFDFERKAGIVWDSLTVAQPDLCNYLKAYTQGVNDYIDQEDARHRDPLYLLWNYSPGHWKPAYSFLIQWYMSYELSFYDDYVNRQELLDKLPDHIRNILYMDRPDNRLQIIPDQGIQPRPKMTQAPATMTAGSFFKQGQNNDYASIPHNNSLGSNNWVLGAGLTDSGQLFLCNDLHLFLTTPNVFYELQLYSPHMHEYGYSIPGVPLVITGHNQQIAWGITNGGWDVTEQYLLRIDSTQPNTYWLDSQLVKMTERHITLHVKDAPDENMTIRSTVFGPVVKRGALSYALHWCPDTWSSAVLSFWKLRNADDWTSFRNALRDYDYPSQNFIYGDTKNNIGMICAGKMPIKPPGYAGGLLDGTRSPHWQYIPFDSLPQSFNPSRNYLFSANQQPQSGSYYFSSRWYDDLYRPRRIDELLSQKKKKKWSLEDLRRMQLDVTDLSVKDLQGLLLKYTDTTTLSANWRSLLAWNGELNPGSREACFYKLFRRAASITGRRMAATLEVRTPPSFDQLMNFLSQDDSLSYKGKTVSGKEQFHQIMKRTDSLYTVNPALEGLYSFSIHQLTELPELDIPINTIGGSDNTINVNYGAHPVIRAITEIGPQGIQSWMINAIGQTGRLNAKGYSQQLPAWISNTLHKTQFSAEPEKINAITSEIIFGNQQ